jgi:hypothetical protein
LAPVSPKGAVAKPPRDPLLDHIAQVPTYRGFGQRNVAGWTVDDVKSVLASHAGGSFAGSGLLADDFRLHPVVADCLNVRWEGVSSLLPRHVSASCAPQHGANCKRQGCRHARWVRDWFEEIEPEVYSDAMLHNFHDDRLQMGQGILGVDWEERCDGGKRYWLPKLKPWHPSQTQYFYQGADRSVDGGAFAATTMNKGLLVVEPGMGRWVLCKATERQPWIHGAVYSLGLDWVGDLFNFLDNLAFEERFGLGFLKYFADSSYPHADQSGNAGQVPLSAAAIASVGPGGVIPLRMKAGVKHEDLELIHTAGSGWEAFDATEKRILRRILLVYLGQDMTSVGQTGGFRQAVIHKETLWQKYGESASWFWDARRKVYRDPDTGYECIVWEPCDGVLRSQLTRWITWFNFRDFDLAPYCWRDATPPEDQAAREEAQTKHAESRARAIATLADKLPVLQTAMPDVQPREWFEQAGVLPKLSEAERQSGNLAKDKASAAQSTKPSENEAVAEAVATSKTSPDAPKAETATDTTEFG